MTEMSGRVRPLLSIVVPVYNEEDNVEALHEAVSAVLARIADDYDWEFIFTDNHSEDRTFAQLMALAERDPKVRVYRFSRNFGFQRSILTGYRLARGDAAVQIDADLQDPPELILDFLKLWRAGYSVVYGIRDKRHESWWLSRVRHGFYRLIDRISETRHPLDAGDFRLVDRGIIDLLQSYDDGKPYIRGYIATLGFPQVGISYHRLKRVRGTSKFSLRSLIDLALDGLVNHSVLPLRLATQAGLACFAAAVAGIVAYAVLRMVYGESEWPAGVASILIMILISTAMNAVFFGILGEYIGRIFLQVKHQPLTIVERYIDRTAPTPGAAVAVLKRVDYRNAIVVRIGGEVEEGAPPSGRAVAGPATGTPALGSERLLRDNGLQVTSADQSAKRE